MSARRGLPVVGLAILIALGLGLRVESVRHKTTPSHDESVSYVVATCHAVEYQRMADRRSYPYGEPAPAHAWQRYHEIEHKGCFRAIEEGLNRTDIHPPLYFWLLHAWSLVFGVGIGQGVALNLLLAALTVLALFGLGRATFGDERCALALSGTWVLNPATIGISTEARPYDLMALVSVLFTWQIIRATRVVARGTKRGDLALLALLTAAGLPTDFLFRFVILGGAGIALARLWPDRRRLVGAAAAPVLGGVMFVALDPTFADAVGQPRALGSQGATFRVRADRVLATLSDFAFGKTHYGPSEGVVVLALIALASIALLVAHRVDAANAALRYPKPLDDARRVVLLDTAKRGLLSTALWRVPEDRTVIAANQVDLKAGSAPDRRALAYVSSLSLSGTREGRRAILRGLASHGRAARRAGHLTL